MIDVNEPEKNDHRATQGLDPGRVDDRCQVVEVPLASGLSVTVSLRTVAPLSEREQALLGDVVRAVAERMEREHPRAGVVQELMLASLRSRALLRVAGHADVGARLGAVVRSAVSVIRDQSEVDGCRRAELAAERESRFRWAEEAARLDAELAVERLAHAGTQGERDAGDDFAEQVRGWLGVADETGWALGVRERIAYLRADAAAAETTLDHVRTSLIETLGVADDVSLPDVLDAFRSRVDERDAGRLVLDEQVLKQAELIAALRTQLAATVRLPDGWRERVMDAIGECDGEAAIALIESWRPGAPGWPCRCGTDETDMVHTPERCYSASEPITAPVSAIVHRATGERHEYRQSSANNCGCPGSGTSAHVTSCELHPNSIWGAEKPSTVDAEENNHG